MTPDEKFDKMLQELMTPAGDIRANSGLGEYEGKSIRQLFDDRIKMLSLTQFQVETQLGIERKTMNSILDRTGKRVDVLNVLKICNFMAIPFDIFIRMYQKEMPTENVGDLEKAKKASFIMNHFDIPHLKAGKVINSTKIEHVEARIVELFGLNNIYEYANIDVSAAFSRTKKTSGDLMREFWVKSAYLHFQGLDNPNPYNRDLLVDLIPRIRPYTVNVEKGLITVARALYNVGVTLIFQPNLPTVQARGATMQIDGRPCIVITDFNKNYPTLWFALMHELHHVLYDLEDIDKVKYHISGDSDFSLIEDKANEFAREYLFSHDKSVYIYPLINNETAVAQFAKSHQIHSSFPYNWFNFDMAERGDKYAWTRFKDKFPDVNIATKDFNSHLWVNQTQIKDSIKHLKDKVFNFV